MATVALMTQAMAGTVIYNNTDPSRATLALGVNDAGNLNFASSMGSFKPENAGATGLSYRFSDGKFRDATAPGCLCEGWGVAVTTSSGSRVAGFANGDAARGGSGGLTGGTFAFTGTQAESKIGMANAPVRVTHVYGISLASNVFQGNVTITNTGATAVNDVVYRRVMDWDVPTTEFREFVTHRGVAANLTSLGGNVVYASDNGFATSNPLIPAGVRLSGTVNTDFTNSGPTDHGSVFDFSFGTLGAGASRTFNIFYGAAENLTAAEAQLRLLNPNVVSIAHSTNSSGTAATDAPTFIFGFGGVAGKEPGLTEDTPILPIGTMPGGPVVFSFPAPTAGRWYDPPFATAFDYRITGGTFTKVEVPTGYKDLTIVFKDGRTITGVDSGERLDLTMYGASEFRITGLSIDTESEAFRLGVPFPVFLDFTSGATMLTITPDISSVPTPASLLLMSLGLFSMGVVRRRRSLPLH